MICQSTWSFPPEICWCNARTNMSQGPLQKCYVMCRKHDLMSRLDKIWVMRCWVLTCYLDNLSVSFLVVYMFASYSSLLTSSRTTWMNGKSPGLQGFHCYVGDLCRVLCPVPPPAGKEHRTAVWHAPYPVKTWVMFLYLMGNVHQSMNRVSHTITQGIYSGMDGDTPFISCNLIKWHI